MVARIDNWQMALSSELSKTRQFKWGKDDCCLFACDVIKATTGIDPASSFRGKYETALGAYKELKRQGFEGIMDVADRQCAANKWYPVPVLMAQRGDIVCAMFEGQESLGVMSDGFGVFVGELGYVRIDASNLIRAWKIS